jgi:hypothetical protein
MARSRIRSRSRKIKRRSRVRSRSRVRRSRVRRSRARRKRSRTRGRRRKSHCGGSQNHLQNPTFSMPTGRSADAPPPHSGLKGKELPDHEWFPPSGMTSIPPSPVGDAPTAARRSFQHPTFSMPTFRSADANDWETRGQERAKQYNITNVIKKKKKWGKEQKKRDRPAWMARKFPGIERPFLPPARTPGSDAAAIEKVTASLRLP